MFHIPRTCIDRTAENTLPEPEPLSTFRDKEAYVILGEQGSGKSESFKAEAVSTDAEYIKARDFICGAHKELTNKTLYIDGLDEVRSGSNDGRIPFDKIREKLIKLGKPMFRLSCREADWYGDSDTDDLKRITRSQSISVLSLQPLNKDEIFQALDHYSPDIDKQQFINRMENVGLDSLMGNPQLLIILAKACIGGNLPESRQQAYELATRQMIKETNDEHQIAESNIKFSENEMLHFAGKLSAHLLLGDLSGYSLRENSAEISHPNYTSIPCNNLSLNKSSLKTRLFQSGGNNEHREPIHRTVAEYLAANFLADLIDNKGLPVGRVLSLMSSSDQIVTSLRGLYAWLAVLSISERDNLLKRDPLGIILYGDPRHLPKVQKVILIEGLQQEANKNPRFRNEGWVGYPFSALATRDMEDVFRKILSSESRSQENQALVDCIIDALYYGEPIPALRTELIHIVKDKSWSSRIRRFALSILLRGIKNQSPDQISKYITLSEQFRDGIIEDIDKDLTGTCLQALYPDFIKPEQVFDFLINWKDDHYLGHYDHFWSQSLTDNMTGKQLFILLDELSTRHEQRKQMQYEYSYQRMAGKILIAGLTQHGESVDIYRLYQWLGIGLDQYHSHLEQADKQTITKWISERPEIYKQLLIEGAERCAYKPQDKYDNCMFKVEMYLFGSRAPKAFSQWLLKQAEETSNKLFAKYCFTQVMRYFHSGHNPDMTLDQLLEWIGKHKTFRTTYKQMTFQKVDEKQFQRTELRTKRNEENKKRKTEWLLQLVDHKNDIERGDAYPSIYQDLGLAYFGILHEANGDNPEERLSNLFSDYPEMISISLTGLSKVIYRTDIPSPREIFELHKQNRPNDFKFGVLAGMHHQYSTQPEKLHHLTEQQIRSAITFLLIHASGSTDDWLKFYIKHRSQLASEIFTEYALYMLKSKQRHIYGSYACAYDQNWSQIAELSAIKILKQFPLRSRSEQSSDLELFLKSALQYADKKKLKNLLHHKLSLKSMDDPQRCQWLASALILDPEKYESTVDKFIQNSSRRVLALSGFFSSRRDQWKPEFDMPASTLSMLIQHIGNFINPYKITGPGLVTREMDSADVMRVLINQLGKSVNQTSVIQFESLLKNTKLEKWRPLLKDQLYELTKKINESAFIKPTLENIINTLENKSPSNPADLMYLTLDILNEHANNIRNGSDNKYRHFWDKPNNNSEAAPKTENDCRDILLSQLKWKFDQLKIHDSKEGPYTEDKRADIKILYGTWNLPIEIKKENYNKNAHDNVWTSLWNQLIKKYTRDPNCHGYGIYLVFWFGSGKVRLSPAGIKPKSAQEMRQILWNMMSNEEKKRIGLCIIDCSLPLKRSK